MAALWKKWNDLVLPHLPGMSAGGLVDHLVREAAIEFFDRSQCWREQMADIAVQGPVSTATSSAVVAGVSAIPVDSIVGFSNGDSVLLTLDDGTIQRTTVNGAPGGGIITVASPLISGMDDGAAVQKVTDVYVIATPTDTKVADVTDALYNGQPITPIINSQAKVTYAAPSTGTVKRFNLSHDDTLKLFPSPASNAVLAIEVALKPSTDADSVPDWVYERHRDAIANGALSMAMALPRKPYSNAQLSEFRRGRFNDAIAAAEVRKDQGNTKAPLRTIAYASLPLDDD